jgi:hypothetical protein
MGKSEPQSRKGRQGNAILVLKYKNYRNCFASVSAPVRQMEKENPLPYNQFYRLWGRGTSLWRLPSG